MSRSSPVQGFLVDTAGRRLEYQWHGPSSCEAPTLVFLHEGLGSLSLWRDFPQQVAEVTVCGALVYSRAGYGRSDPATLPRVPDFMHDEALLTLPRVLAALNVKESILIGHSDGGSIALIYTGSGRAGRVLGLVLEAPHVFVEDVTIRSIAEAEEEYRGNERLRKRLERHHRRDVDHSFLGWTRIWLDPAFRSWNIENYLPQISIPVLVIQGEQDNYGTLKQVQAIERGCNGPVKCLILPNCGHTPHRDQPQAVLTAIADFRLKL